MSTAKWDRRARTASRARGATSTGTVAIFGMHAAEAALANPRRAIAGAFATPNAAQRLRPLLALRNIEPAIESPRKLAARLGPDAVHQGIVILARPLAPASLADLAGRSPVVALDQVTDPRNLGAILRVAAAFDAAGLILTRRHRPEETGLVAKAASGGLEHVPLVEVANLARALDEAREAGYWLAGLDSAGAGDLEDVPSGVPLVLVLGAEGEGLRRLTRERCDGVYRLSMPGPIKSLNVSTAAALALYIAGRRHR